MNLYYLLFEWKKYDNGYDLYTSIIIGLFIVSFFYLLPIFDFRNDIRFR